MKEIADDQGKQVQQLAALERVMKKQERETRAEQLAKNQAKCLTNDLDSIFSGAYELHMLILFCLCSQSRVPHFWCLAEQRRDGWHRRSTVWNPMG